MKLMVILWAYGILKVVDPSPTQPYHVFFDPERDVSNGAIAVTVTDRVRRDPPPHDPVGTLKQGKLTCDVEQLVYGGP